MIDKILYRAPAAAPAQCQYEERRVEGTGLGLSSLSSHHKVGGGLAFTPALVKSGGSHSVG